MTAQEVPVRRLHIWNTSSRSIPEENAESTRPGIRPTADPATGVDYHWQAFDAFYRGDIRNDNERAVRPSESKTNPAAKMNRTARSSHHWQGEIETEARSIASCFNELADKMEKDRPAFAIEMLHYYHTAVNWLRQLDGKDAFCDLKHFLERLHECERIMADDRRSIAMSRHSEAMP